jgi:hypothetical protein
MFYAMSNHLEYYLDRISIFVAMAPAITINNSTSLFLLSLNEIFDMLSTVYEFLGIHEVFQSDSLSSTSLSLICYELPEFC